MHGLTIRKLADASAYRVARFDPETGEKYLADAQGVRSPRPLLGVRLEEPVPDETRISTNVVNTGVAEGWIALEGGKPVVRPAGATQDQWMSTHTGQPHTFIHADAVVFHTIDGDIRFEVTHQPDKYVDSDDDGEKVTKAHYDAGNTRVDWFYDLKRES